MPPGFMSTLWRNEEAFKKKYLSDYPGFYSTSDAAYIDKEHYVHIMARTDDIINTAGHRLSTASMEEVLISHDDIVEAAVVGARDELKGEIPVGFVVVKSGRNPDHKTLEKELIRKIRHDIGPVAAFKMCFVVEKLPKTRSGKILRNVLHKMVDGKPWVAPPTIEDPTVLPVLEQLIRDAGLGHANIQYEEDIGASPKA
jgi:propionyl-CoA synthetase